MALSQLIFHIKQALLVCRHPSPQLASMEDEVLIPPLITPQDEETCKQIRVRIPRMQGLKLLESNHAITYSITHLGKIG